MKKTFPLFYLLIFLSLIACSLPGLAIAPQPSPSEIPQVATVELPTAEIPAQKTYTNSTFGFGFQFPPNWFGPDEYISDQTLRVEIGSDMVYPYGTGLDERVYQLNNSYYVVIQYSKNDQNPYWSDTYQSLLALNDGESLSDARSLTTRISQINLGNFTGVEFISTLSEAAQTEPVYTRQVILFDDQSNLISVMGNPNNVDLSTGINWHDAYRMVDEAYLEIFHAILESITTG